jgi:hypothetical protein
MKVISARNVNDAYAIAMLSFPNGVGVQEHPSRNGPMWEFDTPVTTVYKRPEERVLFDKARDCNPFLHFFEALWMLAGRNDLGFLTQFAKNMANFSDDGLTLNGAYGHRWRRHFRKKSLNGLHEATDQIAEAIYELSTNPNSRRVIVQMWDGGNEDQSSKDIPCNTSIMWKLRNGSLDMTVTNRSNDLIWGCYGANAVHFSMLHEYVAGCVGVAVGTYYQVSNSLHMYPELPVTQRCLASPPDVVASLYETGDVSPFPMFGEGVNQLEFDSDLVLFFANYDVGVGFMGGSEFNTPFFSEVVVPMWNTHQSYKNKGGAHHEAVYIGAPDWQRAALEWLERRGVA